uniref:Nuclear receptor n=1 Tax=Caenorhabditis tropicalis TaxID=1561998 RepID=A0A1I7TWQ3_9PELO
MKPERPSGYCGIPPTSTCLVCEHPDGGSAHFGSTSCLACAAFFRRTVSLNIQFQCKKDKNCTIFHELRMICRACRFDKCVKAGMRRECVQKRRSNKKIPKKHQMREGHQIKMEIDDSRFECPGEQSDITSPLSIEKKSPPGLKQQDSPPSFEFKYDHSDEPSTSSGICSHRTDISPSRESTSESKILTMNGEDLLRFYVDQLKMAMDRRRMIFTDTALLAVIEDRGDVPFDAAEPPAHSLKRQYESQRFDNLLAFDFCKVCPGFDLLEQMEKAIFYRSCSLAYCLLDIAWITVQAYKEEKPEPVLMYTDGSVATVNDMSYGWDDEEDIDAHEKKKLFLGFVQRFNIAICRPIRTLNLTHVEFAALKALCIWKLDFPGYCEFTPSMKVIGKEHEEGILQGLHNYYEDLYENAEKISERLGNLILLMGTVFEMNQLIMETYKSAELFALFKLDALSKSLLTL